MYNSNKKGNVQAYSDKNLSVGQNLRSKYQRRGFLKIECSNLLLRIQLQMKDPLDQRTTIKDPNMIPGWNGPNSMAQSE